MSDSPNVKRKLAAVMFTDIAGFTKSMSFDENKALSLLEKKESILKPLIKEYNGTYVKGIGDGSLSYFNSATDAAKCSMELQKKTYDNNDMGIRVGIHVGDIVLKGDDVFGDGVNIASRLESLSPIGGVCVSKNVYDELENKKEFNGTSLGIQSLKGVGRLVEVYALRGDKLQEPDTSMYKETEVQKHNDDEVPSIAIIPFENKGADEDVFYAYGISADLISEITSAGLIRVSSKKQIDDAGDLPQDKLAKKLGVRYMANGELWRMGDMFQLSVELYDTKDSKVIWADRWQENWDNLPTIKGNLSDGLLKFLDTTPKEGKKLENTNPDAYEFYLKAKHKFKKRENIDDIEISRGLVQKAIELDDNLITAKILFGRTYMQMGDPDMAMKIYTSALKHAEEIGDKSGIESCLNNIGSVYWNKDDYDKALDHFEKSYKIKEELGDKKGMGASLNNIGLVYHVKDDSEKALDYLKRSIEIAKEFGDKSGMEIFYLNIGNVYLKQFDYNKGLDYYERSLAICEDLGDKSGIGNSILNIGGVFVDKGDYDNVALEFS